MRPPRHVVETLLAARGTEVVVAEHELVEDVDGLPLGVSRYETEAILIVNLALLGWTQEEWDDPRITQ